MDITQEIQQLVGEYKKSPHNINNGECEDFAMTIIERMGGYTEELREGTPDFDSVLPGHYWIEYKGKYYDAECPSGVSDWHKLPVFRRANQINHAL